MALENIVNAGKDHAIVSNIARGLKEQPGNPEFLNTFFEFCNSERDYLTERMRNAIMQDWETNPFELNRMLNDASTLTKKKLIDEVSGNYGSVMNSLSDKGYEKVAIELPDEGKDFYVIERKLRQGDLEGARKAYVDSFESPLLKLYMSRASEEFIAKFAEDYAQIAKSRFLDKFATKMKYKGETIRKIDSSKVKNYVIDKTASASEDDKKTIYQTIGNAYAAQKLNGQRRMAA